MGWIGNAFKSFGRKVGKFVEGAGDKLGSKTLQKVGQKIQDVCSETSRRVGETTEYEKERANMQQTVKMNEILAGFSIGLQEQADALEMDCIGKVQAYYKELISVLEKTNSGIGTKRIKGSLQDMKRSIDGSIKKHLAKRVSLDDRECLKILEMNSGSDKEFAMKKYGNKVISEALDSLSLEISRIAIDQNEEIKEYLEDLLEKQKNEFEMMQSQFNKILEQSKVDVMNKESATVTPKLLIEISDAVIATVVE